MLPANAKRILMSHCCFSQRLVCRNLTRFNCFVSLCICDVTICFAFAGIMIWAEPSYSFIIESVLKRIWEGSCTLLACWSFTNILPFDSKNCTLPMNQIIYYPITSNVGPTNITHSNSSFLVLCKDLRQIGMRAHSWSRHHHLFSFNCCSSQLIYTSTTPLCHVQRSLGWPLPRIV